eukprot:jgi/Mesvir1/3128/Mv16301-RA.1
MGHGKRRSAAEILKESTDPVVLARDAGARCKCGKADAGCCAAMTVPELRALRTRFWTMRPADRKEEIKAELRHGGLTATSQPGASKRTFHVDEGFKFTLAGTTTIEAVRPDQVEIVRDFRYKVCVDGYRHCLVIGDNLWQIARDEVVRPVHHVDPNDSTVGQGSMKRVRVGQDKTAVCDTWIRDWAVPAQEGDPTGDVNVIEQPCKQTLWSEYKEKMRWMGLPFVCLSWFYTRFLLIIAGLRDTVRVTKYCEKVMGECGKCRDLKDEIARYRASDSVRYEDAKRRLHNHESFYHLERFSFISRR